MLDGLVSFDTFTRLQPRCCITRSHRHSTDTGRPPGAPANRKLARPFPRMENGRNNYSGGGGKRKPSDSRLNVFAVSGRSPPSACYVRCKSYRLPQPWSGPDALLRRRFRNARVRVLLSDRQTFPKHNITVIVTIVITVITVPRERRRRCRRRRRPIDLGRPNWTAEPRIVRPSAVLRHRSFGG